MLRIKPENFKKLEKFHITNKKLIKKLAEGMELTHKIFTKNNIYYLISFGSLLGVVRHGKIIPWDDDADLLIYRQDIDKIMDLKKEFNKHGWTIEMNWKLLKIKQLDDNGKVQEESFIDLFIIDEITENKETIIPRCMTKDYKYRCNQPSKNQKWWHSWFSFPKDMIKDRKLFNFKNDDYNFNMYGPKNPEKILKFWYGNDCLTMCQSPIYDHNTGKYIKSEKIECNKLKEKFNI